MRVRSACIVVILLLPTAVSAQDTLERPVQPSAREPSRTLFTPRFRTRQSEYTKSPGLAGVLSFFIPLGTGSFYAGNAGHGARHLLIAAASIGVAPAGFSTSGYFNEIPIFGDPTSDLPTGKKFRGCERVGCKVAILAAFAFVGNWIWGTVTAVDGANQTNRARGTVGFQMVPLPERRFGVALSGAF